MVKMWGFALIVPRFCFDQTQPHPPQAVPLSRLRARAPRGLTVHRTVIQYPRFRYATRRGR